MKRSTLGIIASVVVLAVVLVVVLVFGVIPYPDFASLSAQPDPSIPGTIAFMQGDDPPCAMTIPASGGPAFEVGCGWEMGGDGLAWTVDGMLVTLDFRGPTPDYVVLDPATGAVIERLPADVDSPEPLFERPDLATHDGMTVMAGSSAMLSRDRADKGAVIWVSREGDAAPTVLLEVDGPRDYRFQWATWSPDGNWVLVSDSLDRLLIVSATGDPTPRILVEDVQSWSRPSWYIPGLTEGTFPIPGR